MCFLLKIPPPIRNTPAPSIGSQRRGSPGVQGALDLPREACAQVGTKPLPAVRGNSASRSGPAAPSDPGASDEDNQASPFRPRAPPHPAPPAMRRPPLARRGSPGLRPAAAASPPPRWRPPPHRRCRAPPPQREFPSRRRSRSKRSRRGRHPAAAPEALKLSQPWPEAQSRASHMPRSWHPRSPQPRSARRRGGRSNAPHTPPAAVLRAAGGACGRGRPGGANGAEGGGPGAAERSGEPREGGRYRRRKRSRRRPCGFHGQQRVGSACRRGGDVRDWGAIALPLTAGGGTRQG